MCDHLSHCKFIIILEKNMIEEEAVNMGDSSVYLGDSFIVKVWFVEL